MSHGEFADGTDRRTVGRETVTLRFPPDAAGIKSAGFMFLKFFFSLSRILKVAPVTLDVWASHGVYQTLNSNR